MKKYAPYLLKTAIVAVVIAITLISCETTDNPGPTDARDNFLGSWFCTETPVSPSGANTTFNVNITKDVNDSTKIKISNFNNLNVTASAVVTGTSLNIALQNIGGSNVQGSGTYSSANNKINLNYSANDGLTNQTYTAVYSK